MIYDHKDKATMVKYKVRAFPTFVITDAEGNELARQVGSTPLSTTEKATDWFSKINTAIDEVPDLEAKYAESADSIKIGRKLGAAYVMLGRSEKAADVYDGLVKNLDEKSKDYEKSAIEYAGIFAKLRKPDKAAAIYDKLLARLDKESADYVKDLMAVAKLYAAVGKSTKALEIYDSILEQIDNKDSRYMDVRLAQGDAMMNGLTRSSQAKTLPKIVALYDEILPALIKSKDDRAVKPSILAARIKALFLAEKDYEGGRKLLKRLLVTFPKHDKNIEIKYWRAFFAIRAGDSDVAADELEAIIKDGPKEHGYVKRSARMLKNLKKSAEK